MQAKHSALFPLLVGFVFIAVTSPTHGASVKNTVTFDASQTGSSKLRNADAFVANQSASTLNASFTQRRPLFDSAWHWGLGLRSDNYFFETDPDFPIKSLHADSARVLLEYHRQGEAVAYVMLSPGFYFENEINGDSFDVPVEMASGIPIAKHFNGVLGVSLGRYFHHPVPIAGFIWDISKQAKLHAVYPEPKFTYQLNDAWETGVAGQLIGAGFNTDEGSEITQVNYFSYRVGALLKYRKAESISFNIIAGFEMRREFDAYRQTRRLNTSGAPYAQVGMEF